MGYLCVRTVGMRYLHVRTKGMRYLHVRTKGMRYLHVRTVGMSAENIKKSIQKNRHPALLRTFVESFPIPRYNNPIRMPTTRWAIRRRRVRV